MRIIADLNSFKKPIIACIEPRPGSNASKHLGKELFSKTLNQLAGLGKRII
jgi:hypothetical protein